MHRKCCSLNDIFSPDLDVELLANQKPGRRAEGRKKAYWDQDNATHKLLKFHLFYKAEFTTATNAAKKRDIYKKVSAALWYYHSLDYSYQQCSDKFVVLTHYFFGVVMRSPEGQNGTSSYLYYKDLCKFHDIIPKKKSCAQKPAEHINFTLPADLSKYSNWRPIPASMGKNSFSGVHHSNNVFS